MNSPLKADLHLHTRFSPDSLTDLQALVDRCQEVGLDCIAVTDHNTIQGALEVQRLAPFLVIVGEEVMTSQGEVIGLFLREEIPPRLTALETVRAIKEQGGLVALPHPFDPLRSSLGRSGALEEVLSSADIIEVFNAHDLNPGSRSKAVELAERHRLAAVAVSDAHSVRELGHTYTELLAFDGTAQGLLGALAGAQLQCRRASLLLRLLNRYAVWQHRLRSRSGSRRA
ncbi:MAG: PHP domain-containing protein [Dehalococcoidia bacterium]